MKCPHHGIKSTTPKPLKITPLHLPIIYSLAPQPAALLQPPVLPLFQEVPMYLGPAYGTTTDPNLIGYDDDKSNANIFSFGAFADKNSGIVYHGPTGLFPFMLYDGSVCFFILYHYESNSILMTTIVGLDDVSIYNAYKTQFELLTSGFKPKLNIMDNQATKHIKTFLTKNDCKLQLVEPHNHCVNAAERAIQTLKDAFMAALATTDSNFPLQLRDRLKPKIQDTLNLLLLELSKMGTYVKYPYHGLHRSSTQVMLPIASLQEMIPVTWYRYHVFLREVIWSDHYQGSAGAHTYPFPCNG
jgi:hypothetical protein